MLSMSEEIINVSKQINMHLKNHVSHHNAKFSDNNILVLMVLQVLWTIKSIKHFHRLIKEKFTIEFPNLPEYSAYLKRTKKLGYLAFRLIKETSLQSRDDLFIIDTKPVPLLEIARANRSIMVKIFKQYRIKPSYGYCSARNKKYFGFKLVALWNKRNIVCYSLVSANISEQGCLMELVKRNNLMNVKIFGDKGFILKSEDKVDLSKLNIIVEAIPRKNMKIIVQNLGLKKYRRKAIESCFSVLKSFDVENITLKSLLGFTVSINIRVLAYNLKNYIQIKQNISSAI